MAIRINKRIRLAKGVSLNLGKRGVGLSVGAKGARVGVGTRGPYTSVGIPGTGVYSINYVGRGQGARASRSDAPDAVPDAPSLPVTNSSSVGCVVAFGVLAGFIFMLFLPTFGLLLIAASIVGLVYNSTRPAYKAEESMVAAQRCLQRDDLAGMITHLLKALKYDPDNELAHSYLIMGYYHTGSYQEAVDAVEQLDNIDWLHPDFRIMLGDSYFKLRQYDKAIATMQRVPDDSPAHTKAVLIIGASFLIRGEIDNAIESLKMAPMRKRKLDQDLMEVHYLLGEAYSRKGDNKNALKHFKKVYLQDVTYRDVAGRVEEMSS